MVTYPEAVFDFTDQTARGESRAVSTAAKEFADTALLRENIRQTPIGTLELNQFVLDGSREIYSKDGVTAVPFWSDEKSDGDGHFSKNPTLEVSFQTPHSSIGLNLIFSQDIPAETKVTWYTLYGTKLKEKTFYPDSEEYFCACNVQNYGKIILEFVRTTFPHRYVRLDYIEYGRKWTIGRNDITEAKIQEETDMTGASLPISTAELRIADPQGEFDPANTAGLWTSLQKEQKIVFTEYVGEEAITLGNFFLSKWDYKRSIASLSFMDVIGVLDKTTFYRGEVYTEEEAGRIIGSIMESCGIEKYEVTEEVYHTRLNGWLGIQTHRSALQQVLFACGAAAERRSIEGVRIYRPDRQVRHMVEKNRKFLGATVSMEAYVSGVTLTYNGYTLAEEAVQITGTMLPKGETRLEFSEPCLPESITVSGGSLLEAATNYAVVLMPEEGECTLSGRKYETCENSCSVSVETIEAGETANIKNYKGCTLAANPQERAKELLDYHRIRRKISMRYLNRGEKAGDWCEVAAVTGGRMVAGMASQTLDLSGGNIGTATFYGYAREISETCYAGQEIYAGEGGLMG